MVSATSKILLGQNSGDHARYPQQCSVSRERTAHVLHCVSVVRLRCAPPPEPVTFSDSPVALANIRTHQVVCGSWWSMAVTVDGYCYAWGSADGGWTGLERPTGLSVVDPIPSNDR